MMRSRMVSQRCHEVEPIDGWRRLPYSQVLHCCSEASLKFWGCSTLSIAHQLACLVALISDDVSGNLKVARDLLVFQSWKWRTKFELWNLPSSLGKYGRSGDSA